MFCTTCGTTMDEGGRFCTSCGAENEEQEHQASSSEPARLDPEPVRLEGEVTEGYLVGPPGPPPGGFVGRGPATATGIDLRRLSIPDIVVGVATALVLISLFLPWYTNPIEGETSSITALDSPAGGWRIIILVLSLAVVAYLVARAAIREQRALAVPHWQILLLGAGTNLLFVVVAFLAHPENFSAATGGAAVGLLAAVVAVVTSSFGRDAPTLAWSAARAAGRPAPDPLAPDHPGGADAWRSTGTDASAPGGEGATACWGCGSPVEGSNRFCTECGAPRA